MDAETLRTLITCGTTVLVALISNILVLLITRTNDKKSKDNSILEQQYNKVFSPIHRILFFTDIGYSEKIKRIYSIIYSNYQLSTKLLREEYENCVSKNTITIDFKHLIDDGCKCLEKALGYTTTKLSKQQKEISKNIIYSGDYSKKYTSDIIPNILTVLGIFTSIIVAVITIGISDLSHSKTIYIILLSIIGAGLPIVVFKFMRIIDNYRK